MGERTRWAPGATVLADSARAVSSVAFGGSSSDDALQPYESASDRAAIRAVTLGTLRWFLRLSAALEPLLSRPEGLAEEIRSLLLVSAHQIEYSRNAPEMTVHTAVDATRILNHPRASALLNAVLRRLVTNHTELFARADRSLPTRTAHPAWLVESLRRAWPAQLDQVLEANNAHPPLVLRVDLSRGSVPAYVEELAAVGLRAQVLGWTPAAIQLEKPVPVSTLPSFRAGRVSVQDAGAQLAAGLLDVQPGMRVLDACAAPGGKTGHLLETSPGLSELVAVDVDEERLGQVRENLERTQRAATLVTGDVGDPESFWDGRPFDRILVDAPCSSTGVIRRHPDIKLLRRSSDIPRFTATQAKILKGAFRMLAPGGRLLYVTCSLLPKENEEIVARLLQEEGSARAAPMPAADALAPGAVSRSVGIQLLPGAPAGTDGFYYACLEKTTAGT